MALEHLRCSLTVSRKTEIEMSKTMVHNQIRCPQCLEEETKLVGDPTFSGHVGLIRATVNFTSVVLCVLCQRANTKLRGPTTCQLLLDC